MSVPAPAPVLDRRGLEALEQAAQSHGLLRLGVARLDDADFEPARREWREFLAAGKAGDMAFLPRSAETRADPALMLPGAKSVLVALVPHGGEAGPVARYAQHVDYHRELYRRLEGLSAALEERFPGARTLACVDTRPLLERSAATIAGLGFIGKNGMLIAPGLGSYVMLGALLCTAELDAELAAGTTPPPWDACGQCTRCLEACPTQAFDGPGRLDPRRCISYLTIEHRGAIPEPLAARMGERVAGCDVCQEVCPYNASASRADAERAAGHTWLAPAPGPRPSADPVDVARLRTSGYKKWIRGTALGRIPRNLLRRNALIALGNRPGPCSPAEAEVIRDAAEDGQPRVAEAARWAARRRGLALDGESPPTPT